MIPADLLVAARDVFRSAAQFKSWTKANPGEAAKLAAYWQTGGTPPALKTAMGQGYVLDAQAWWALQVAPAPTPPPVPGLVFPRDPMILSASGGGKQPVVTATDATCVLTGEGISRVYWEVNKPLGQPFTISCRIDQYDPSFRGTVMRLEDYHEESKLEADFPPGMYRLELDRYRDGQWYVVRNRIKSTISYDQEEIIKGISIPSGAHVELRGVLSPDPALAHTSLIVDGKVVGTTVEPNWSGPESPAAERARFGGVAVAVATKLTVSGMSYQ